MGDTLHDRVFVIAQSCQVSPTERIVFLRLHDRAYFQICEQLETCALVNSKENDPGRPSALDLRNRIETSRKDAFDSNILSFICLLPLIVATMASKSHRFCVVPGCSYRRDKCK